MAVAAPASTTLPTTAAAATSVGAPDLSAVLADLAKAVAALQGVVDALQGATGGGGTSPSGGCGCGAGTGATARAAGGPVPEVAAEQAPSAGPAQAPAAPPPAPAPPAAAPAGFDANGPKPTKLQRPVEGGHITSHFDSQEAGLRTAPHHALDIGVPLGTPIHAAADGKVVKVGNDADGYGNYVIILHAGGIATLYAHQSDPKVHEGDVVKAGDVIGLSGSTGNSTGPHLHFEVREGGENGTKVDPEKYL
jgi:murein DD-endopeptidase MepM/ murein hydrolase activator NlpD